MLITFTEDPLAPWWQGVGYALGMFVAAELRSLLMNTYYHEMYRTAMNVMSVLVQAVHEKVGLCFEKKNQFLKIFIFRP